MANYYHVKIDTFLGEWAKGKVPVTQDGPKDYPCCRVMLNNISDARTEEKYICVWDDRIAGIIQKDVEYVGAYKPVIKTDGSKEFVLYIGLKQNECLADPTKPKYDPSAHSGGSGGHSGGSGYSRKDSPEKETSIRRQCCLKCAVELAKMGQIGVEDIEQYLNSFDKMIVSSGSTTGQEMEVKIPHEPAPPELKDEDLPF